MEAQRTALHSGPAPGVGVGLGVGLWLGDWVTVCPAVVGDADPPGEALTVLCPPPSAPPGLLPSAMTPQDAKDAISDAAAIARADRLKNVVSEFPMSVILRWRTDQKRDRPSL